MAKSSLSTVWREAARARGKRILPLILGAAFAFTLTLTAAAPRASAATMQGFYQFGETNEAAEPNTVVPLSNGSLLVTSVYGGVNGAGAVTLLQSNGVASTFHQFGDLAVDNPTSLIPNGDGNYYGISQYSGGGGAFYRLLANGKVVPLWIFYATQGTPVAEVRATDGTYYVATQGSSVALGSIYHLTTSGSLTKIVDFNGNTGNNPSSLLFGADGVLYGTTTNGGVNGVGSVFSCTTTGTLAVIHSFTTVSGQHPQGISPTSLIQVGTTLYGVASLRDVSSTLVGDMFSLATDGSGFTILANLSQAYATQLLHYTDGNYYAVYSDGSHTVGIDKILSGTFVVSSIFTSTSSQPAYSPYIVAGPSNNFYGVVQQNSQAGQYGVVFNVTTTGTVSLLHVFHGLDGAFGAKDDSSNASSVKLVRTNSGMLYGITPGGGLYGDGTLYSLDSAGNESVLYSFSDNQYGKSPTAITLGGDGNLYVTVGAGSTNAFGAVFQYQLASPTDPTAPFATIHFFGGNDGGEPNSILLGPGGNLFGTTYFGAGSVFETDNPPANLTSVYTFSNTTDPTEPNGVYFAAGSSVYGTTLSDPAASSNGTIFKLTGTLGGTFTDQILHDFNSDPGGGDPTCLVQNFRFYPGSTRSYGIEGLTNRLFDFDTTAPGPVHYDVPITEIGGQPAATFSLIQAPSKLANYPNVWGTVSGVGGDNYGGIFDYTLDGTAPVNLAFPSGFGSSGSSDSLVVGGDSTGKTFYGVNETGGRFGRGAVFYANAAAAGYDFNSDGRPDLLWHNTQTGDVVLWTKDNTATLSTKTIASKVALEWTPVSTADFTGDGLPDILWQDSVTGDVALWQMNGAVVGSSAIIAHAVPLEWKIVGCADINGDGHPDIIWRSSVSGTVVVWYMVGASHAASATLASGVGSDWALQAVVDLNRDGHPDLVWRNTNSGQLAFWFMNGTTLVNAQIVASGIQPQWQVVGSCDLNGDGDNDLLWRNTSSGDLIVWYMDRAFHFGTAVVASAVPSSLQLAGPK